MRKVVVGGDPPGHGPCGWLVELCGTLHRQGLSEAYLVALLAEDIEPMLLGNQAPGRGNGGLSLEGAMHAFVDGVLLGAAGLDQLGADAERDEPDREGRQTRQGRGGEGDTVVGADPIRETEFVERACEALLSEF